MAYKPVSANNPKKPDVCLGCKLYEEKMVGFEGELNPDILFVGGFPVNDDIRKGLFFSRGGVLIRNMVKDIKSNLSKQKQPRVAYAYAVKCFPSTDFKISKEIMDKCSCHLEMAINRMKPKVIVALGADAAKALGISGSMRDSRGNFYEKKIGDHRMQVLTTLHPISVNKEPGKVPVLKNDIEKAFSVISGTINKEDFVIDAPKTYEGVLDTLTKFESAVNVNWETNGTPLAVAIDTETSSLLPYKKDERMIAISVSYAENHGFAIPWQHKAAPFTEEQYSEIFKRFSTIVKTNKIYVIMHNAKFDNQWLNLRYGLACTLAKWDTMLVEHILNEDKKGEYSLKDLTSDYYPGAGKYEEELKHILVGLNNEVAEKNKLLLGEYREKKAEFFVDFLLGLGSDDARRKRLSGWIDNEYITMTEAGDLAVPCYRKGKSDKDGKAHLLKKYTTMAYKILVKVPIEEFEGFTLEPPDKDTNKVTYEDIPIDVMLKYATIDAIMTRKIAASQQGIMHTENGKIKRIEEQLETKLPTKSVFWPLHNITMLVSTLVSEMEYLGVKLNRKLAQEYIEIIDKKLNVARANIIEAAGRDFNPKSPDELSKVLYEELRLPILKRGDGGKPSTDAETLKFLSDDYDTPILRNLLTFRKLEKVRNTYIISWLKKSELDGHLHGSYNLNGTSTYRLSSSNPNLLGILGVLKHC